MLSLLIYPLAGVVAGTMAGLFGIGGGAVIVPVLVAAFTWQRLPEALVMHLALGTSLATIVVTSLSSITAHQRRGGVRWDIVLPMTPGILAGAATGALLADRLPSRALALLFGLFSLAVALQMGLELRPPAAGRLPGRLGRGLAGLLIGTASALTGIGGGSITVPFLTWCRVPMREAVGSAAACGLPIALAGAAGYLLAGQNAPDLPAGATGYVYWPAFIGITLATVVFAPLGARLAHRWPERRMKRLFALFLVIVGLRMIAA